MVKQRHRKVEWVWTQKPDGYSFEKDCGDCVMFVNHEFQKENRFKPSVYFGDFTNQQKEWDDFVWEHINKARANKPQEYTSINVKIVFRPRGRVEHVLERVRRYDQPATKGNPLCSISDALSLAVLSTAVCGYQPEYEEVKTITTTK